MGPVALPEPSLATEGVPVSSRPSSNPGPSSSLLSPFLSLVLPRLPLAGAASSHHLQRQQISLPWRGDEIQAPWETHHLASQPQPHLEPDLAIC